MESGAYHGNVHARGLVADRGPLAVDPVPTIDQGSDAISVGHRASSDLGRLWRYTVELLGVAVAYFVLAKLGLGLASINPSASPIWPPTGLALASAILMGLRVGPAIFLGALLANVTTTGAIHTSAAIALGNTLESLVGGYLINRWSGSHHTFGTAAGVARFALVSFAAATPISATVGVGSLSLAGYVDVADRASVWLTWWLGDLSSALVITPVIVLWATGRTRSFDRSEVLDMGLIYGGALAVGVIAFSPLLEQTKSSSALGFLAVLPLMWAALRRDPRDTASVAFILSCFAVWGTMSGVGPFVGIDHLNNSFLLLIAFMMSVAVPSLALSAGVNKRRCAEVELRALKDAAEAANRAKSQFVAHMSHELRTPLNAIIGFSEIMQTETWGPLGSAKYRGYAADIKESGAHLLAVINDILDLSKIEAGRQTLDEEDCDLVEIVAGALHFIGDRATAQGIRIEHNLRPNLPEVRADSRMIRQILLNLLSNSVKFTPAGGVISLSAGLPSSSGLCLIVKDTGVGIPADEVTRVLEPFVQVGGAFNRRHTGTGLGLPLAKAFAELHGGSLELVSAVGIGTTVTVRFPAERLRPRPCGDFHATACRAR